MPLDLQRTVVAVSSGITPARRAIVRLSGWHTHRILGDLLVATDPQRQAEKTRLLESPVASSARLHCRIGWGDRSIAASTYFWPDSRSFTGEPCAELHVLGSLPIVESLTEQITMLGAVPAHRGEFTLRSFMAGKIDLTQAEAVLGVIEAESEAQLESALRQLGGNLSSPVRELRDQLVELIAHLEAGLDFVEEDIEFISSAELRECLERIRGQLASISDRLRSRGSRARSPQVVLVGLPNAGKSSLFNALVGHSRAIVSSQAGTTRDAIVQRVLLGELPIDLIDTAGMEQLDESSPRALAQDVLEAKLRQADVALFCIDMSREHSDQWLGAQTDMLGASGAAVLRIGTKCDLAGDLNGDVVDLAVSTHLPETIQALRRTLARTLADVHKELHSDAMHHTMVRCRQSIDLARAAMDRAIELVADQAGEELVAAELRLALDDLSAVIGEVHTEDILGQIFSRFCIGK